MDDVLEVKRTKDGKGNDVIWIEHSRNDLRPQPGRMTTSIYLTPDLTLELIHLLKQAYVESATPRVYRYPPNL